MVDPTASGSAISAQGLQRIIVVGTSCAGKTTLARTLADGLGVAHVELDALYWGPSWQPRPASDFLTDVAEAAAQERWVADGNYSIAREALWQRATLVVWLNYSLGRVLWRGVRRTVWRCLSREPLWQGNRESFRISFLSKDSILWWIVTTHHRRRREFDALRAAETFPALSWCELRRPGEATVFLNQIAALRADEER